VRRSVERLSRKTRKIEVILFEQACRYKETEDAGLTGSQKTRRITSKNFEELGKTSV
jgi:hypothetical protein